MKFLLTVILIALLSAGAECFFPWWTVAIVAFAISLFVALRPGQAFWAGFAGVGIFWLIAALMQDMPNDHILSTRMSALFHLPNYTLFICAIVLVGGLVGGLSARSGCVLAGRYLRR